MAEENVVQVELDFWGWLARVSEKTTFLRLLVSEHRDVSEDDLCLLKILYRIWYDGEYPIYKASFDLPCQTVTQTDLFSGITVSVSDDMATVSYTDTVGNILVVEKGETKTEENNDTEMDNGR